MNAMNQNVQKNEDVFPIILEYFPIFGGYETSLDKIDS